MFARHNKFGAECVDERVISKWHKWTEGKFPLSGTLSIERLQECRAMIERKRREFKADIFERWEMEANDREQNRRQAMEQEAKRSSNHRTDDPHVSCTQEINQISETSSNYDTRSEMGLYAQQHSQLVAQVELLQQQLLSHISTSPRVIISTPNAQRRHTRVRRGRRGSCRARGMRGSEMRNVNTSSNNKSYNCWTCGELGHMSRNCWHSPAKGH